MTPLIKTALSLLAASATGVSGGLLYDNKDEILRVLGWSEETVSSEPSSSIPQTENDGVRVSDSVDIPAEVDQTNSQRPTEDGVPASATKIQVTNLSPVGNGISDEPQSLEVANPVTSPGSNLNSGDSQNLRNQDNHGARLPATSIPPAPALKDFQCAFEDKNYESEPNKKALKELLKEKGKMGLQIILDGGKTHKCARELEESEIGALLIYLNGRSEINPQGGRVNEDALPIAAKQKTDKSWTIFEDDEENETLAPIQENSPIE